MEKTAHVIGYPGPNTVASNQALDQNVITVMFNDYATGKMSADAAIAKAVKAAQGYLRQGAVKRGRLKQAAPPVVTAELAREPHPTPSRSRRTIL